jgi:hypothetical protein
MDLVEFHTFRHIDLCKNTYSVLPTSTLPLSEEGILHHSQFVPEEYKLPFIQGFGQNVCNFLSHGNILKLNYTLLDTISDEVIPNLNILGPVMEYWII